LSSLFYFFFFFQAEDGIRDPLVTGVQTCALPIYRREQEELLAERVEAAVVEHDGRDDVGHVPLGSRDAVEDPPVLPLEVAELRQARQCPHKQRGEDRSRDAENAEACAPAHRRSRIFASAVKRMNGKATVETTSSESATSGA